MTAPSRGAYTRAGADEPDAAIFAAATALIRSIPAQPTTADLLAPPMIGRGVDWSALGEPVPDWVDEVSPSLVALRCLEPPPARPWRSTARPVQLQLAESTTAYIMFLAGRGCVAPWTRIYLPETGEHVRIDELAARGQAVTVQAWTPEGMVRARTDGAPFFKGVSEMFEVRCSDGSTTTVTSHHRFLTPQGWRRCADVHVGSLLRSACGARPESGVSDPLGFLAGALSCQGIGLGCQDRYGKCHRRDGRQLLEEVANVLDAFPSTSDAAEHPHACWRAGGCAPERLYNPPLQYGSRNPSAYSRNAGRGGGPEVPGVSSCSPPFEGSIENGHRSLSWSNPLRPVRAARSGRRGRRSLGCGEEALDNAIRWVRVVSVRRVGVGPYYDLTVPGPANYVAEGLVHHNSGKTWAASNAFAEWALTEVGNWAVVAPTFADARQICVEGPSGLLVALGDDLVSYDKSKYEIRLRNGSLIYLASDDAPARLRGKNLNGVWVDELGSFRNLKETWEEGIEFATRIGSSRRLITTTPKRGNRIIKELNERGKRGDPNVTLLRGSTMDNSAHLSQVFLDTVRQRYAGTTLGRQELDGELLDEVEGALVTVALIDATRVTDANHVPLLRRIVVGVDPCVTAGESSDACGIVVVGIGGPPMNGWVGRSAAVEGLHLYFLADHTMRGTPRAWSLKALQVAEDWDADAMIVETNQGGDLCTTMLRMVAKEMETRTPRVVKVHASVGKRTRAEPVAGVFEQCRAHIVGGIPGIEDGFTSWVPGDPESPNELDAAVWGAVGLMPALAMKGPSPVRVIA